MVNHPAKMGRFFNFSCAGLTLGSSHTSIDHFIDLYLLGVIHLYLEIMYYQFGHLQIYGTDTRWTWKVEMKKIARINWHIEVPITLKWSEIHHFWLQILKIWGKVTQGSNFQLCNFFQSKIIGLSKWKKINDATRKSHKGGGGGSGHFFWEPLF